MQCSRRSPPTLSHIEANCPALALEGTGARKTSLKIMVKIALRISMITRRLDSGPLAFGRRPPFLREAVAAPAPGVSDDLKLFALTYCAGFVFVTLFLA